MLMARMSRMDAAFLATERPRAAGHLGMAMIFGPGEDGPLTFDAVRALIAERLPLVPSARRVVANVPLGLGRPSWAQDLAFDLDRHVQRVVLPRRQANAALAEFVGEAHSPLLDRAHPLWRLWVVEGLPRGRVAVVTKIHVATIDDKTGAELLTALLDPDPDVRPAPDLDAEGSDDASSRLGVLADVVSSMPDQARWAAGFPSRLAERVLMTATQQWPGFRETAVEVALRTPGLSNLVSRLPTAAAGEVIDEHPTGRAPRLSFNAPITPDRQFAFARLPIDDILAVKHSARVTFNDVVVTVCAGALRRWLLAHDELPTSPVLAMVPVLVAGGDGDRAHMAGLVVALPTELADPALRLARTHEALRSAKERHSAVPASVLQDVSMFASPAVAALAGRFIDALPLRSFMSPAVNLSIINVPGPLHRVYLAGRPLESSHPVLSVSDESPLNIGLQSGPDGVGLGLLACRDTFDDLDTLTTAASIELRELSRAVVKHAARA
jgi:diacylglycerol O-acyltransferase / wax synthase